MTNLIFFILFTVFLAFVLLFLNLLLAPHSPYKDKLSPFECGFYSFRGQNRTEFSISFFIFGLVFLLLDLEILLVYPYSVSSYNNGSYGLFFVIVFLVILTVGFVFELAKGALKIESKQTGYLNQSSVNNLEVKLSKDKLNLSNRSGNSPSKPFEIRQKRDFNEMRAFIVVLQTESSVELHDSILFYLITILFGVG